MSNLVLNKLSLTVQWNWTADAGQQYVEGIADIRIPVRPLKRKREAACVGSESCPTFPASLPQVDLRFLTMLTAIATQGAVSRETQNGYYVKSYKLEVSTNGEDWMVYRHGKNHKVNPLPHLKGSRDGAARVGQGASRRPHIGEGTCSVKLT